MLEVCLAEYERPKASSMDCCVRYQQRFLGNGRFGDMVVCMKDKAIGESRVVEKESFPQVVPEHWLLRDEQRQFIEWLLAENATLNDSL